MRRLIAFDCAGETLLGTLDLPEGEVTAGLVIVSGGNEIRAGAHRGMAMLAARLVENGVAVFRYDRRGVGDSSGENPGYEGARDDLIAAATTLRRETGVTRLIGVGNCDAATTLALWGREAGLDAVVLANPWVVAPTCDLPAPAAVRAHYRGRLRDPRAWLRLLRGGVSFGRLLRGLRQSAETASQPLTARAIEAIAGWGDAATIVLAARDNTAIAYADAAHHAAIAPRTISIDTASHSFARNGDAAALETAIRDAIARV